MDTHCGRLSNRIGLTESKTRRYEKDLMEVVPREKWNLFCHQLVFHGRAVCNARKPACTDVEIRYCDYGRGITATPVAVLAAVLCNTGGLASYSISKDLSIF